MSRIGSAFETLRRQGEAAFIPFLTAGDPDRTTTRALVLECAARGADLVELGIPFSDPLADGTTIQRASQRALAAGATLRGTLGLVEEVRRASSLPLVLMGYYNPILRFGLRTFPRAAVGAGVDGLIVPDLPPEEAGELRVACEAEGLDLIFLVTPTSPDSRISLISAVSRGYIYYVSLRGVTGARRSLAEDIAPAVARIRNHTDRPVAVGFGIGTPEQARQVAGFADGVIVGSAIVAEVEAGLGRPDLVARVGRFVGEMKAGVRGGRRGG